MTKEYTRQEEARLVAGLYAKQKRAQYDLFAYCKSYYDALRQGVFYAPDEALSEIFQNSFIKLWENIENGRIYAEDNVVKGKNKEPLTCGIRTYFMGIAKLKYLEWLHDHPSHADVETEMSLIFRQKGFDQKQYMDTMYGDCEDVRQGIIADHISQMSERCCQILTKFYYEEKDLDTILFELRSIESKNALKTKKYKCLETLRKSANETYKRYLNS